jgi:hypothetical protein
MARTRTRTSDASIDLSRKRNGAAMWLDYKNQPSPMQAERMRKPPHTSGIMLKDANAPRRVDSPVTDIPDK